MRPPEERRLRAAWECARRDDGPLHCAWVRVCVGRSSSSCLFVCFFLFSLFLFSFFAAWFFLVFRCLAVGVCCCRFLFCSCCRLKSRTLPSSHAATAAPPPFVLFCCCSLLLAAHLERHALCGFAPCPGCVARCRGRCPPIGSDSAGTVD